MTRSQTLRFSASAQDCRIEIAEGLVKRVPDSLGKSPSHIAIICDDKVRTLYGEDLQATLRVTGHKTLLLSFPTGEASKTRQTAMQLQDALLDAQFDRDALIIGLGGGVSTDLAGYLAASTLRGLRLINVPTSLLGMVDASIGGKTGVNTPQGKNLVGHFWQPEVILIDPSTLLSLPDSALREGCCEMLKHGVIADADYWQALLDAQEQIFARELHVLESLIAGSCAIKAACVEEDSTERAGKRRILNFGHSVGHALELCTQYQLSHGEAVALGMLAEARLAELTQICQSGLVEVLRAGLEQFGFALQLPGAVTAPAILKAMSSDKKRAGQQHRIVLPESLGRAAAFEGVYCRPCSPDLITEALHQSIL